jgi:hypothetical protein
MSFIPQHLRRNSMLNIRDDIRGGRTAFSDLINQVIQRGEVATEQPRLSAQDLFGEQITRLGDSARQMGNATKQAISRSLMAGGGDPSGAAGANLLGVDQQVAEQIGRQGLQFEGMAQQENRFGQSMANRLLGMGMQGLQGLFGMDQTRLQDELMRRQARADQRSNIFGNILQAGTTIGAAALMACWVAAELYGMDSNEFHSIRGLLIEHEKVGGELNEFFQAYKEHGEQWAEEIKSDPIKRAKTKALFDQFYELSQAA